MKKLITSFLLLALPLLANAQYITVENADGVTIYYNYINNGTELEVAGIQQNVAVVNIPEEVTYMSRTRKVTRIGNRAFDGCGGLTSVTIPNSVTSIGNRAFYGCSGLTSVTIPNSVTSIGGEAFEGCSGLTSVTIPNSVTTIGGEAFSGCSNLKKVDVQDIASWCAISFTIGPYEISNPLWYARHLYLNGEEIKDLVIPNSVTSIGWGAFVNCTALTSVTIPNSVTSIGSRAFEGCMGLTSVVSKMENPCDISPNCFPSDVFYNVTLYVPKGTTDKYKATNYWNKFLFIEEGEPGSSTQPEEKKCATPSISYANKKLTFSCETDGVEYHYNITDVDIKSAVANSIDLSATYEISVYATKSGYTNSDLATATLVWTDAVFTETTPSTSSAKAVAESIPMLISAKNGNIVVKSEQEGQPITVYAADGKLLGSAMVKGGQASISTTLKNGHVAIVKVGNRSVKVKM